MQNYFKSKPVIVLYYQHDKVSWLVQQNSNKSFPEIIEVGVGTVDQCLSVLKEKYKNSALHILLSAEHAASRQQDFMATVPDKIIDDYIHCNTESLFFTDEVHVTKSLISNCGEKHYYILAVPMRLMNKIVFNPEFSLLDMRSMSIDVVVLADFVRLAQNITENTLFLFADNENASALYINKAYDWYAVWSSISIWPVERKLDYIYKKLLAEHSAVVDAKKMVLSLRGISKKSILAPAKLPTISLTHWVQQHTFVNAYDNLQPEHYLPFMMLQNMEGVDAKFTTATSH